MDEPEFVTGLVKLIEVQRVGPGIKIFIDGVELNRDWFGPPVEMIIDDDIPSVTIRLFAERVVTSSQIWGDA